ncbi:hypothetical protein KQX54_001496 [Cotesia glomerata]|uniref:EB domain-containing protein n=1 Tax=Cotesia glomerata TaxID=32391 RepID=A0AAV7IST0_COTGL|nr:hypothetical protein KQX54_001496 [Cotesia glomerata]
MMCVKRKYSLFYSSVVKKTTHNCSADSALYYCENNIDCGVPWRSTCYQNHCVCNANHIALNALTCLPVLDGTCWKDDQCMTKNSHCDGSWCQCKPGFVSVSRRSESTLQGRTDGNTRVLIPNVEIPDGSEKRPISAVDYVVVEISTSNSNSLTGVPVSHSSISEFDKSSR